MTGATPSPTITATAPSPPTTPVGIRVADRALNSPCFPEVAKPHTLTETVDVGPAPASALVPASRSGAVPCARAQAAHAAAGRPAGVDALRRPVRKRGARARGAAEPHVQRRGRATAAARAEVVGPGQAAARRGRAGR